MHLISTHITMVHTTHRNVPLVLTQIFIYIQNLTSFNVCIYTLSHLSLHPRFQICHTKSKPAIFHFKVFIHLNSCIFKERKKAATTNTLSSTPTVSRLTLNMLEIEIDRKYINIFGIMWIAILLCISTTDHDVACLVSLLLIKCGQIRILSTNTIQIQFLLIFRWRSHEISFRFQLKPDFLTEQTQLEIVSLSNLHMKRFI